MSRNVWVVMVALALVMSFASTAWADDASLAQPGAAEVASADVGATGETVCLDDYWCDRPRWSGYAGGIFLQRARAGSVSVFRYMANDAMAMDVHDLSFDHELGPEVELVRHGNRGRDLQVRYFGIQDWSAETTVHGSTNEFRFHQFGLNLFDIEDYAVRYRSKLDSLEVNLSFPTQRWLTPLAGVRWVQLHESGLTIVDQFQPGLYDRYGIRANNALVGVQIGAAGRLWNGPRLHIDSVIKGGLYGNTASRSFDADVGLIGQYHLSATDTCTAFVGELGFSATYQVTQRLAVRAGYEWMWLDGVALAPDQMPGTVLVTTPPTTQLDRSTLMLNGATVGVELTF